MPRLNSTEVFLQFTDKIHGYLLKSRYRCREWLKVIGNEKLVHLSIDGLNKTFFVCGDHFEKADYDKDGNLVEKCVPKLKMNFPHLTANQLNMFPAAPTRKTGPSQVVEDLVNKLKITECTLESLKTSVQLVKSMRSSALRESVAETMRKQNKKPKQHNWTKNNKIAALTVYKQSPKEYKYLTKVMPLPCIKSLQDMLNKLQMDTGIDHNVLHHLKILSSNKSMKNRMCVLAFDEMPLRPYFEYNELEDKIEGFEDLGPLGRSQKIADCAGVFMIQGLNEKFKQPIAYYFVEDTISSETLAVIIKEVIKAVNNTGYKILAIVCDQKPANMQAIAILQEQCGTESKNCFMVDKDKVFIVYDVPYLFKELRNEFLEKGKMTMNGMTARWTNIEEFLQENELYLHKISSAHVTPTDDEKLTIRYAAELLSHTISGMLKLMSCAKEEFDCDDFIETATIVDELDQLFDYTNGASNKEKIKKAQRKPCSFKSNHVAMWRQYQETLTTVEFLVDGLPTPNTCVEGYILTLTSLEDIWRELVKLGFKLLDLRTLNLDALQNLFASLHQICGTDTLPTITEFTYAMKIGVLSEFSPHNPASHREEDQHHLLINFHHCLFGAEDSSTE
ncbi:hypothetical protein O3G_MSEX008557 [Manduca sexta]|uniref:THAP-type domain-containing protein n=1 Tax=Manduca sexta TaxID=7130 RepID=A0A921ZB75_MANSE|nr:hypothetical protein O3G_MSEX008557 [Manduca sexta]